MLLLTTTTDFLQVLTGSALSTDWTSSYVDVTTAAFTPDSTQGNVATATSTTIVASPAASTQRQVKFLSIRNRDGVSTQTISIIKNAGAVQYRATPDIPLLPGESLQYVDGIGFQVFDSSGRIKSAVANVTGPAGPTGNTGAVGPAVFLEADPGEEGQSGPPGAAGATGTTGSTGSQGPVGPAVFLEADPGEEGQPGTPGIAGPAGATGGTGGTGAQGPQGVATFLAPDDPEPGDPGPPGAAGVAGTAGGTGSQGPVGPPVFLTGDPGEDGDVGPPGPSGPSNDCIVVTFDGGGAVIPTGDTKTYFTCPFDGTIQAWYLTGDPSGSIVIDVWKLAGAIPTAANTIAGSEFPTLSAATVASDLALTTWNVNVLSGDIFGFSVTSASSVTKAVLSVKIAKK